MGFWGPGGLGDPVCSRGKTTLIACQEHAAKILFHFGTTTEKSSAEKLLESYLIMLMDKDDLHN